MHLRISLATSEPGLEWRRRPVLGPVAAVVGRLVVVRVHQRHLRRGRGRAAGERCRRLVRVDAGGGGRRAGVRGDPGRGRGVRRRVVLADRQALRHAHHVLQVPDVADRQPGRHRQTGASQVS